MLLLVALPLSLLALLLLNLLFPERCIFFLSFFLYAAARFDAREWPFKNHRQDIDNKSFEQSD